MSQIVLVTGFGPFARHPINASSEVLKILKTEAAIGTCYSLECHELPVVYKTTKEFISDYWKEKKPLLVVHLGVYTEKFVSIECQCNETTYVRKDVEEKVPSDGVWPFIKSSLPIEEVFTNLKNEQLPVQIKLSRDAGTYLCQYSFHNSLVNGNGMSVFIHVPRLKDCPAPDTAVTVRTIIAEILKLLE